MRESLRDTLAIAAETGEVIHIIYHGGSQPGTVRGISPISVTETEVRARELASGIVKTFKLAKTELADGATKAPEYELRIHPTIEEAATIGEAFSGKVPELESLGWHVELSDEAISVHRFFKNGKVRKTPDVELGYHEYTIDAFVELDGTMKEERRKSCRPYHLYRRNLASARTFGKISSAVSAFLDEASKLAPTNAT